MLPFIDAAIMPHAFSFHFALMLFAASVAAYLAWARVSHMTHLSLSRRWKQRCLRAVRWILVRGAGVDMRVGMRVDMCVDVCD